MLKSLRGSRTYIAAGVAALATFLNYAGVIDDATFRLLIGLAGSASAATLRAGIKNDIKEKQDK